MARGTLIRTKKPEDERNPYRFWQFQLVGWGWFFVILLVWNMVQKPSWLSGLSSVWAFITGFVLTSAFRSIIKQREWLRMNPLQLILPVIITTVLAGVIWSLSILGFVNGIGPFLGADPTLEWRDVLNQIVNSVAIVFVWSILYFSLHFIEIGQRSRIEKYKLEA